MEGCGATTGHAGTDTQLLGVSVVLTRANGSVRFLWAFNSSSSRRAALAAAANGAAATSPPGCTQTFVLQRRAPISPSRSPAVCRSGMERPPPLPGALCVDECAALTAPCAYLIGAAALSRRVSPSLSLKSVFFSFHLGGRRAFHLAGLCSLHSPLLKG